MRNARRLPCGEMLTSVAFSLLNGTGFTAPPSVETSNKPESVPPVENTIRRLLAVQAIPDIPACCAGSTLALPPETGATQTSAERYPEPQANAMFFPSGEKTGLDTKCQVPMRTFRARFSPLSTEMKKIPGSELPGAVASATTRYFPSGDQSRPPANSIGFALAIF